MSLPRPKREHLPAAALALASVLVGALIFGAFLVPFAVRVGYDEAYMVPFAERLIDGHFLPYVDAVSQRGPVLYWTLALAQLVFGRYEWVGIRVLGLAATVVTSLAITLAGVEARHALAGAVGAMATVFVVALVGGPSLGVNGETLAAPLLAVSFWLATRALVFVRDSGSASGPASRALVNTPTLRRRALLLAAAGALTALATLTKQTAGIAAAPIGAWALAHAWTTRADEEGRSWLLPPFAFVAGFAAIVAAVVSLYAARHALSELVYWGATYNSTIYMAPYRARYWHILASGSVRHGWVLLTAVALCAFAVLRVRRARDAEPALPGFELSATAMALVLFATSIMPARFWVHYFMIAWPWVGLVAGLALEHGLRRTNGDAWKAKAITSGSLVAALAVAGAYRLDDIVHKRASGAYPSPHRSAICRKIARYAGPDESIFVWGFSGNLYVNCRRSPATRFTYLTLVAGIVPPFWNKAKPEWVAKGARDTLVADLEASKPPVIVDAPIHGYHMSRVPELASLLDRGYCLVTPHESRKKTWLYVRRGVGGCPAMGPAEERDEATAAPGEGGRPG